MAEFALVVPLLLVLAYGIFEAGRATFMFATLQSAAADGAREAVHAKPAGGALPTNADVLTVINGHVQATAPLTAPCPNGYKTGDKIRPPADAAPNTGYVYITSPDYAPTAPAGETGGTPDSSCAEPVPAVNHVPITVTIVYRFAPLVATPTFGGGLGALLSQALPPWTIQATMRTEY